MKCLGIIPARYQSSRFPGKPLVDIEGKTMIRRVYERATLAGLDKLVVATDDERVLHEVKSFGGEAIMTGCQHASGTDRCGEVLEKLGGSWDIILNIQGDEPFLDPAHIRLLRALFEDPKTEIGTLATPLNDIKRIKDPNTPKIVFDRQLFALYFSRSAIPFFRGLSEEDWPAHQKYYKHIGIYAFRQGIFQELLKLAQSPLEEAESLEQLRWLENGYRIKIAVSQQDTITIDSPEDLLRINSDPE